MLELNTGVNTNYIVSISMKRVPVLVFCISNENYDWPITNPTRNMRVLLCWMIKLKVLETLPQFLIKSDRNEKFLQQ